MGRFDNKVVIITGASSGIGAETAVYFTQQGASLVIHGRDAANLQAVADKCKKIRSTEPPLIFLSDVTDEKFAPNIIQSTITRFGKIDVLVNNAGALLGKGPLKNLEMDIYSRLMDINLTSVIKLTKEALPHLAKTKGNIVNVSSFLGHRSAPNMLAYSISKAGLDQFTKCLALELAPEGIRVNSVNPGVILTAIHERGGLTPDECAKYIKHNNSVHPLGRVGTADEVATVIGFLASDDASFMTGALLPIDGGKHAAHPR